MCRAQTTPELLNPFALPHGVKVTVLAFGVLDDKEVGVFFLCSAVRCHKSCRSESVSWPPQALRNKFANVGFGAAAAAPIARRVFDYWLEGRWPSEDDIAATRRGESSAPLGVARRAAEIPLPGLQVPGPEVQPTLAAPTPAPAPPPPTAPKVAAVSPPVAALRRP